eukprot:CAMPEP_0119083460 /NCGR_PEP_ID=MMETSP1178-20130426/125638_1 /TAXON_ID=33656 /ORGANISM="unid sp, Strain CCMP2000" /LENGTH=70 /DNA_ID=CAMNT_0007066321 /DNA_START=20 /DNA_END=229 /DNA_ORIENTATION=+
MSAKIMAFHQRKPSKSSLELQMERMLASSDDILEGGAKTARGLRRERQRSRDLGDELTLMAQAAAAAGKV